MVKRFSGVARPWADRSLRPFQKLHQQYQCLATYAVGPAAEMGATTKIDVNPVPTSADERAIQLLRYTFRRGGTRWGFHDFTRHSQFPGGRSAWAVV